MSVIRKITQIGIVTRDIKQMMRTYEAVYGIGPWTFMDGVKGFKDEAVNITVNGKPCPYKISLATCRVGDMELELIEPLDDKSIYSTFLAQHGEGVQHISFDAGIPGYQALMADRNIPCVQSGYVKGIETFEYYDTTPDIGFVTEIHVPDNG